MSEKKTIVKCLCELENGYIFKNFFSFISLRGHPEITFLEDRIRSNNRTADDKVYGTSYFYGDEINLTWDSEIPSEERNLTLTFDSSLIQGTFGKIKKKDQVRITVIHVEPNNDYKDDDYFIYLSCGAGRDGREGLQNIPAKRVQPSITLITPPLYGECSRLIIPCRIFRQMVDTFSKCKKQRIHLYYFDNMDSLRAPGIIITTNRLDNACLGGILEKYGEVPDLNEFQEEINSNYEAAGNTQSAGVYTSVHDEDNQLVNEFIIDSEKINIFCRFASMHNEGSVRIYYQFGRHLQISFRFGSFGESELFLYNKYVNFTQ